MLNENNIITSELKQSVIEILSLILNKNSFTFNNEHFLIIHGTAMGSSMAPTYANIFMAILERKLLNEAPQGLIPIKWIRFINDTFAIWTHDIEKVQKFLSYINNFHPTIKFDYALLIKNKNQSTSLTQLFTFPTTNSNQTYTSNQLIELNS
jgi:hypothetical protein